jgi:hypothetical protein
MPSTSSAYSQVVSRRFASANPVFPQLKAILATGSIPGSSIEKMLVRAPKLWPVFFCVKILRGNNGDAEQLKSAMSAHRLLAE